jgi:hypothetical protein
MPNAENLIQSSGDGVKSWHSCACCTTPIAAEHTYCFNCESLPGKTGAEKRTADFRFIMSRRVA